MKKKTFQARLRYEVRVDFSPSEENKEALEVLADKFNGDADVRYSDGGSSSVWFDDAKNAALFMDTLNQWDTKAARTEV